MGALICARPLVVFDAAFDQCIRRARGGGGNASSTTGRVVKVACARGRWSVAAAFDLALNLSILSALGASIALNFARLSYLGILLPVITLVMATFLPIAAWAVRAVARLTLLLAVMQALLLGWALAATLPLIN